MNRIFLFCILLFLTNVSFAEYIEKKTSTSLFFSFSAGVRAGEANSFVYEKEYLRSKLDWPMIPVWFYLVSADISVPIGLCLSASVSSSFPSQSGTMIDSDYLNGPGDSPLTHKSTHNGYLENGLDGRLTVGWEFLSSSNFFKYGAFSLNPNFGFRYMRHKWTGKDGYLQYPLGSTGPFPVWDESITKDMIYGPVLAYEQEFIVVYPELEVQWSPHKGPSIALSGSISPFLWASGLDNHLHPDKFIDYLDLFDGQYEIDGKTYQGWYQNISLTVNQNITSQMSLFTQTSFTSIEGLRGSTLIRDNKSGIVSTTSWTAGTSWSAFSASLGIRSRLR